MANGVVAIRAANLDAREASSGRRSLALDGMRGVAAGCVVNWSLRLLSRSVIEKIPCRRLLFVLSGFVLTHAYEKRLGNQVFLAIRMIRLLPLWVVGLTLGLGPRHERSFADFI
jgi:peptidoglycan/LPS O-acetylase OafA/YrhL